MMTFLLTAGWLGCSLLAYPIFFGHLQNNPDWDFLAEKDYRKDLAYSVGLALLGGPISLAVVFFGTGFVENGMKWK